MTWLRRLWCWFQDHDRIAGICVLCYRGPQGERLIPISGGQFDPTAFTDFASDIASSGGGGYEANFPDPGGFSGGSSGGGGGFWSDIGSGLSKFASGLGKEFTDSPLKAFSSALGLGATGLGIKNQFDVAGQIGKQTKNIEAGQKQAQSAAAPAVAFGTETLNRAAGGNLTPAMQAQIDQFVQKAKADITSRFASMGLGNSDMLTRAYAEIDQRALVIKGQMLQQQEETALAGLQTGVSAGTGVMGVSQQQQAQLAALLEQANKALGSMTGRQA